MDMDSEPLYDVVLVDDLTYPIGDEDSIVEEYITIYEYSGQWQWEVIQAYITEDGELNLTSGHHVTAIQDLNSLLKGKQSECIILLNHKAEKANRILKALKFHIESYQVKYTHSPCKVLKIACENKKVRVDSNQDWLITALGTHYDPDNCVFPIIFAFEAFGNILKHYTK